MRITPIYIAACLCLIWMGCSSNKSRPHFFLAEYPQLYFTDEEKNVVHPRQFITHMSLNGVSAYIVQDHSLTLRYEKTDEPYSGFIRTYHWGVYNIEAVFEGGKIRRLRYWHPNRQLAMDMDYISGIGSVWNYSGALAIIWDGVERQYRNPSTNKIRQITNDSLSYYFNLEGELSYYTSRTDSTYMQYYANGSPRFMLPIWNNGERNGIVRRWHQNGQIQVTGQYRNGEESGTWIEYDSLGREIERQEW